MSAEDPSLKGLSVNKSKMLDFFVGKNSQSSASQVTDAHISKKNDVKNEIMNEYFKNFDFSYEIKSLEMNLLLTIEDIKILVKYLI